MNISSLYNTLRNFDFLGEHPQKVILNKEWIEKEIDSSGIFSPHLIEYKTIFGIPFEYGDVPNYKIIGKWGGA